MVSKVLTLVALLHGGATAFASPGIPGAVNASRGPEKALLFGGVESFLAENGCGNCHACGTPVEKPNRNREKVAARYAQACGYAPPSPGPAPACADKAPPGGHSCSQQKKWGKCSKKWMKSGGYCCKTCFGCEGCSRKSNASLLSLASVCSQEEFAVVLAMAMQESDSMEKTDTSKHGGATNVSPFNMNFDELGMLGCDESCARGLGQYSGSYDISASIMWLLKGIRGGSQIGTTEDFLNYHRDGVTGWKACRGKGSGCDCGSKGCKAYRDAVADAANLLLESPSTMANGQRVCEEIKHIRI